MWHTKALIAVLKVILFWQPFFSVIQSYRFLCRCLREGCTSQNHWVVEVMREMTSGDYLVPLKQVQMMMVAPDHVQIAFEYLQEGECHNLPHLQFSWKESFFPMNSDRVEYCRNGNICKELMVCEEEHVSYQGWDLAKHPWGKFGEWKNRWERYFLSALIKVPKPERCLTHLICIDVQLAWA